MQTEQGVIALMGSGELSATMVEVHKSLLRRYGPRGRAVFVDTPAGFQLNVDHISRRAADYFDTRVTHPLTIASIKGADTGDLSAVKQGCDALRQADYILIGPGSPTYALAQWRRLPVPELITQCIAAGGSLVASSAAALTVGRLTLPVYEIYKVGRSPYWENGLNILAAFGFDCIVIPHWNNAEGGNHDTRYCFMGEPRLRQLELLVPVSVTWVGLDEHTALIVDLSRSNAEVKGVGRVTLRRNGEERVFSKGDLVPLALLRGESSVTGGRPTELSVFEASLPAPVRADVLWESLHTLADRIRKEMEKNRMEQATSDLLELETHIWRSRDPLMEKGGLGAARQLLRDILAELGSRQAQCSADPETILDPLVGCLLSLRETLRKQKQYAIADALRECLSRAGVQVADTPSGVTWHLEQ